MNETSQLAMPDSIDALLEHPTMEAHRFGCSSDDWLRDPERMARCYEAAEHGADGSTHYEVIEDWRRAADAIRRDCLSELWRIESEEEEERAEALIEAAHSRLIAAIDACEAWHEDNGSLHDVIG